MNSYVTDSMAREHLESLFADAAAARRVAAARRARRGSSSRPAVAPDAQVTVRPERSSFFHPFVSMQHWLQAGRL